MSKKYELSLWRDYPGAQEIKEEKVAIIAATGMDYSGRAQNIVLSPQYTGEINLTFELPVKYFDSFSGEWVINPLAKKLQVKSKIKLWRQEHWFNKYANPVYDSAAKQWTFTPQWEEERWYDFIINQRTEKRSKKKLVYEFNCISLFVNELSRTGYSLEFKSDSQNINENSIGTAHQLAEKITRDTDWQYINSEVFPDYKSIFNTNTGEIEKIPVATDQIEFLEGLKQYNYCYNYTPTSTAAALQVIQYAENKGQLKAGQAGFNDNGFFWYKNAADIGKEDKLKDYIYGHNQNEFITSYAEKYIAEECGVYKDRGYAGISIMSDLSGGWVNQYHKDVGVSSIKEGTGLGSSIRYYRTLDFTQSNIFYNICGENTRLPCGTLLAVQIGCKDSITSQNDFTFSIYEGKDWAADTGYSTPVFEMSIQASEYTSPFANTYYIRVPSTVENPHFAISFNGHEKITFTSFLVYKMTGYTESIDKEFFAINGNGLITTLSTNVFNGKYSSDELAANSKNDAPIWIPLGKITITDYTKEIYEYLIETYIGGNYYQIYLPAAEDEVKKISSYGVDKRRAISGEKSNRFSLLTTVCETFKCFFKFIVEHNSDGTIKKDEYGSPFKYYTLVSTLGNNQFNGFTYGVNLDEVSRTIDAENLVSKLYVETIDNEYNDTGLVSIQQSQYNDLRENFIYNFGYYILRGMIDKDSFYRDYNIMKDIVYNDNLALEKLNEEYLNIKNKKFELDNEVYTLKATNAALASTVQKCLEDINWQTLTNLHESTLNGNRLDIIWSQLDGVDIPVENTVVNVPYDFYKLDTHERIDGTVVAQMGSTYISVGIKDKLGNITWAILSDANNDGIGDSDGISYLDWDGAGHSNAEKYILNGQEVYLTRRQEYPNINISKLKVIIQIKSVRYLKDLSTFSNIASFSFNSKFYSEDGQFPQICGIKEETIVNTLDTVASYQDKYRQYLNTIALDEEALNRNDDAYKGYNIQLQEKSDEIERLTAEKNTAIANFERKYSQFIIEGTWKGDDYIDNDIYYLDASQTAAESCMPKIEYSLSAIDISKLANPLNPKDTNWGEDFSYDVGDTTYIKDQELFGINEDKIIEQKSMIASKDIYIDVDRPDEISLKNYDTRFEELFQSIAATVTELKYNEDIYGRAANFNPNGTIDTTILQKSFDENKELATSSNNNKVINDRYGITVKDIENTGKLLRIVAGGVLLSKDNGLTYTTGISADGINGTLITAGEVDTSKVVIRSSEYPSLQMDELGLTAYRHSNAVYDSSGKMTDIKNPIVRHDQFGFYLARDGKFFGKNWMNSPMAASFDSPEEFIENYADIAITQLGVSLQSEDGAAIKLLNNIRTIKFGPNSEDILEWGSCIGSFDKKGTDSSPYFVPRVRLGYIRTKEQGETNPGEKVHGLDIYDGCLRIYGQAYKKGLKDEDANIYFKNNELKLQGTLKRQFGHINGGIDDTEVQSIIEISNMTPIYQSDWGDDWNKYFNSIYFESKTFNGMSISEAIRGQIVHSEYGLSIYSDNKMILQSNASSGGLIYLRGNTKVGSNTDAYGIDITPGDIKLHTGGSATIKVSNIYFELVNSKKTSVILNTSNLQLYGSILKEQIDSIYLTNTGGSSGPNFFLGDNATFYLNSDTNLALQFARDSNGTFGFLSGEWYYNGTEIATTGSDKKIKHDISSLSDKYSTFFDQLRPVSFIYNKNQFGYGTSQRTHTGFIANEVETALTNSGLTTQEFAGFVHQRALGKQEDLLCLRYEEFIALNTSEIQKLKKRVAELESQIALLTNSN